MPATTQRSLPTKQCDSTHDTQTAGEVCLRSGAIARRAVRNPRRLNAVPINLFVQITGLRQSPAHWWRKRAVAGDADGQAMLGAALHLGMGVEHAPVAALAWLLRARTGGSVAATPFVKAACAALNPDSFGRPRRKPERPSPHDHRHGGHIDHGKTAWTAAARWHSRSSNSSTATA